VFNGVAALSLVLCVALPGLWVRSYFVVDGLHFKNSRVGTSIYPFRGQLFMGGWLSREFPGRHAPHYQPVSPSRFESDYLGGWLEKPVPRQHLLGFWHFDFSRNEAFEHMLAIPLWLLMLVTLTPPALWLWRGRRAIALAAKGRCIACGYDLRATPDRCPECGMAATKVAT
jgi:hypothetical protein